MHRPCFPGLLPIVACSLLLGGCGQKPEPPASPIGSFVPDTKPAPPIRWTDATVPKGTTIAVVANTKVSAATSRVGTPFNARVTEAIVSDAKLAIPENSTIEGYVAAIEGPGKGGARGGAIRLAFKVVSTQTGASAPIAAHVAGGKNWRPPFSVLDQNEPFTIVLDEPLNIKVRQ